MRVGAKDKTGDEQPDSDVHPRLPCSYIPGTLSAVRPHSPPPRRATTTDSAPRQPPHPQNADSASSTHPGSNVRPAAAGSPTPLTTRCSSPTDVEYTPSVRPARGVNNVPASTVQVPAPTNVVEASKRLAAWTAVDMHVTKDCQVCVVLFRCRLSLVDCNMRMGDSWIEKERADHGCMQVIGIGSGSTVPYVVERIVSQGPEVNKDRVFIPTGAYQVHHAPLTH